MKAIIFGANGQDGYYLSDICRKRQIEVIGISRSGPWIHGDVSSQEIVEKLIRDNQPTVIFHLAATSTTNHDAIYENHATIGNGTINILESVKEWSPSSKVFIAGSGLQFVNRGEPICETDPFCHASAYVASRNYSVYLARYFRSIGIQTYVGYLFHHESPLRQERHVCQKIACAAHRIATGSKEIIELGDISVRKELTYAADIAEGIMTLIEQDEIFESVIGSGKAFSIENWLDECFKLVNLDWKHYVVKREDFKSDYPILISNPTTINSIGWYASTSIAELAKLMIDHQNKKHSKLMKENQ